METYVMGQKKNAQFLKVLRLLGFSESKKSGFWNDFCLASVEAYSKPK